MAAQLPAGAATTRSDGRRLTVERRERLWELVCAVWHSRTIAISVRTGKVDPFAAKPIRRALCMRRAGPLLARCTARANCGFCLPKSAGARRPREIGEIGTRGNLYVRNISKHSPPLAQDASGNNTAPMASKRRKGC